MGPPSTYIPDMSDAKDKSPGRSVSMWVSEAELDALAIKAKKEHVTRNEAARRAIREYAAS